MEAIGKHENAELPYQMIYSNENFRVLDFKSLNESTNKKVD